MGGGWQLDLARTAAGDSLIHWFFAVLFFLIAPTAAHPQTPASETASLDRVSLAKQLCDQHKWLEVVQLAEAVESPSPELNYYAGIALAQLERLDEAHEILLAAFHQLPGDKRFPIELAGVEFRRQANRRAASWLHRALAIDPGDDYANDFLGTLYFLDGNLEAALKYWNRIEKPFVEQVRSEPEPALDPVLLDSAFAFAPGSTLKLDDLRATKARIAHLAVFPLHSLQLAAEPSGSFDVVFRSYERKGWGRTRTEGLLRMFRGVFAQTVYPEYFNIGNSGMNFTSMLRWDKQKRRYAATLSAPLRNRADRRYSVAVDVRNENWNIRASSQGPAPLLGSANMRRQAVSAEVVFLPGARWNWQTGVEASHRDFRNVFQGSTLAPELLLAGYQLKHTAGLNYELLRIPERRFTLAASARSELGRIWSRPAQLFAKVQGESALQWFPQSRGTDYEIDVRVRGGTTFSDSPFDELFQLGLERDNDLGLRAHIGSRDGRKGSAPLGRKYVLVNSELNKFVFSNGWANVRLAPFLDSGRIFDHSLGLAPRQWLWDTGVQMKAQVLGVGLVFTYGKDLRSGNNVFYVALGR